MVNGYHAKVLHEPLVHGVIESSRCGVPMTENYGRFILIIIQVKSHSIHLDIFSVELTHFDKFVSDMLLVNFAERYNFSLEFLQILITQDILRCALLC